MVLIIRKYSDGDFSAVCAIEGAECSEPYSQAVFIRQAGVLFPDTFLVAESGGEIIGYTIGAVVQGNVHAANRQVMSDENTGRISMSGSEDEEGWIIRMAVRKDCHGRHVGEGLFLRIMELMENIGVKNLFLTVSPGNLPACSMYEKHGFKIADEIPCYFGEGKDRLVMQKRV